MTSLRNRRVLITGGAIRVGSFIARAFLEEGAILTIHCRNSRAEAEKLLNEFGGETAGHSVFQGDLTSCGIASQLIDFAKPEVLINNAATYIRKPFDLETSGDIQVALDVNFYAPLALMKAFAAQTFPENADPVVINLVDQAVAGYAPDAFGYLLSKKALADATRTAALAYAPRIRVNAIAPGPVLAPEHLKHLNMQSTLKRVPLGRSVPPADIAMSAVYLAGCRSVTGEILFVDGGQHINETHHP